MAATYLTTAEAKTHLRVDHTEDDDYIEALCELVEEVVLNEISGTFTGKGSVTTAGTTALVGTDTNFLDYNVGDTIRVYDETDRVIATITDDEHLTVTSAFSTSEIGLKWVIITGMPLVGGEIPLRLKQAMLLLVAHLYAIREPVYIGTNVTKIPFAYEYLLNFWKNYTIA